MFSTGVINSVDRCYRQKKQARTVVLGILSFLRKPGNNICHQIMPRSHSSQVCPRIFPLLCISWVTGNQRQGCVLDTITRRTITLVQPQVGQKETQEFRIEGLGKWRNLTANRLRWFQTFRLSWLFPKAKSSLNPILSLITSLFNGHRYFGTGCNPSAGRIEYCFGTGNGWHSLVG